MTKPTSREPAPYLAYEETADMGEAMRSCTPGERAFVAAMLIHGAQDRAMCAYEAGFGNTKEAAAVQAHHMIRRPRVAAALREEADRALQGNTMLGQAVLHEIALDRAHPMRFKAAVELLNRGGLVVETRHRVTVEEERLSPKELQEQALVLFKRLFPAQKVPELLEAPMDAEFVEVHAEDGIEDLLS